jgi:hypothetical protein
VVKKIAVMAVLAAMVLGSLPVGAQTGSAGFQYLSLDIGFAPVWDFDPANPDYVTVSQFGFNVRVSDSLIAGIQLFDYGGTTSSFLLLKYNVLPRLRAVAGFGLIPPGTPPNPAANIGVEIIPFTRTAGDTVITELKLGLSYVMPFDDPPGKSKILFALALGIGF